MSTEMWLAIYKRKQKRPRLIRRDRWFWMALASWAQVSNHLSLSDKVDKYLPVLRNSPFGNVSLLNLGTHTPGGFRCRFQMTSETRAS
jgi:Beta-lactamase